MTVLKLIIFIFTFSLISCKTDNKVVVEKWDNGKSKLEIIYSDTPNCFIEKKYYENGQLASETKFIDSIENGESVAYYDDGNLLGKFVYKNGKINGEVLEFHKTGNLMFKGNQIDGKLVGTAINYYANGKPETITYFKDNKTFLVNYWDSVGTQLMKNGNGVRKYKDLLSKDRNDNEIMLSVLVVGTYKDSLRNGLWKYYSETDNKLMLEREFNKNNVVYEKWSF